MRAGDAYTARTCNARRYLLSHMDPAARALMGQRAREVLQTGAGATRRTVAALARLLPGTAVPDAEAPAPPP